jgi:hypothetical protein
MLCHTKDKISPFVSVSLGFSIKIFQTNKVTEVLHKIRNTCKILVVKPEGKRPLGRPRRRWEYNIRIGVKENKVRRCRLDSSGSGSGSLAGFCEYCNEPSVSIKGGERLD